MKRRPLTTRDASWAKLIAKKIAQTGITPNQISIMSIAFALMSGISFYLSTYTQSYSFLLLILGVLGLQLRLLCNLFDGMVAVEYGKKTNAGELFNDAPDRISDILIILGFSYSTIIYDHTPLLGFSVIIVAILTAYVRVLGGSMNIPQSFKGPMAKQHRMAVITGAVIVEIIVKLIFPQLEFSFLYASLWIMLIGGIITCTNRLNHIFRQAQKA